jgi:hypothetical protein
LAKDGLQLVLAALRVLVGQQRFDIILQPLVPSEKLGRSQTSIRVPPFRKVLGFQSGIGHKVSTIRVASNPIRHFFDHGKYDMQGRAKRIALLYPKFLES